MLAPVALAGGGQPGGYVGNWTAFDCATGDSQEQVGVDCDVWGDASTLTLHIAKGATPHFVYQDSYEMSCAIGGSPSTVLVVSGTGYYETNESDQVFFIPITSKASCGNFQLEGYDVGGIYWDEGSDTLWQGDPDGDGWGHSFVRAH